jgi:hypothetical protein
MCLVLKILSHIILPRLIISLAGIKQKVDGRLGAKEDHNEGFMLLQLFKCSGANEYLK